MTSYAHRGARAEAGVEEEGGSAASRKRRQRREGTDAAAATAAASNASNPAYACIVTLPSATRCIFFADFSAVAASTATALYGCSSGALSGTIFSQ